LRFLCSELAANDNESPMGIYSEYLDRQFSMEQLAAERKRQLERIGEIRDRDVLVFAANAKLPTADRRTRPIGSPQFL
jgi:hypothetical protein